MHCVSFHFKYMKEIIYQKFFIYKKMYYGNYYIPLFFLLISINKFSFLAFILPFSYHQVPEFIGKSWFSRIAPSHRNTSKNLVSKQTKQMETTTCSRTRSSEHGKYGACGSTLSSCACIIPWRWKWRICTTFTPSKFNVFLLSTR